MAQITLLDGSVGQELVKRSGAKPTPMWSTSVMLDHPDYVGDVHRDYFRSGATVATTNTYPVHRDRMPMGNLEDRFEELIATAMAQAEAARDAFPGTRIAGSLGPVGASYRPDLCPPPEQAAPIYAELVALMRDHVDLFLHETVVSVEHAEGALMATKDCGKPVWLAVSVNDDDGTQLRSGEPLSALSDVIEAYQPDAVLINCSRPEAFRTALGIIETFGKPFGGYANGFTKIADGFLESAPTVDALTARTDLTPDAYADYAMSWVDAGATIVGGCCEVGPDHIKALADRLQSAGHQIV